MTEEIKENVDIEEEVQEEEEIKESEPETVMVGEKEYSLVKTGRAEARQISDLLNWLGKYGESLADSFVSISQDDDGEEEVEFSMETNLDNAIKIVTEIGKIVSEDALLDLFVVVTGCSTKEANEHFNVLTLVDATEAFLVQDKYIKVINRFF